MEYKEKRRKLENGEIKEMDLSTTIILQNQEKLLAYVCEIGRLCENSYSILNTIQTKMENMEEKVNSLEKKSQYIEKCIERNQYSIERNQYNIIQELKSKDNEIISLKELNENIIKDYESKIQIYESELEKRKLSNNDSYSFYS